MRCSNGVSCAGAAALACVLWVSVPMAQQAEGQQVEIPKTATTLEGVPAVRLDSTEQGAARRVLTAAEAAKNRLSVRVDAGQFYWTSRDNRPLRLDSTGGFTYLQDKPGSYIRFTKVGDKITYVEHVDRGLDSVTYWGELRIVLGK